MKFDKKNTLTLLEQTYCRITPSPLGGVGVTAVRDIPAGINPFPGMKNEPWHIFQKEELSDLDPAVMKMLDDFCVIEKDGTVSIPESGLSNMDMSFYVNTSPDPNLDTIDGGFTFITNRAVRSGDELTVDYGVYDEKW